jgi:hypothetical protein
MRRLTLPEWAAVADIVGTVAVVVSLLFLAYTIEQNTAVTQSVNDNFLYELDDRQQADVALTEDLAIIFLKHYNGEELSGIDESRLRRQVIRQLSAWELAFDRHEEGLLSDEKWKNWNRYYSTNIRNDCPKEWWADLRKYYGAEFAENVDAVYEDN